MGIVFIRRTQTRRTQDGKPYFSHRLVHSERVGNAVRQRTLLNLGRHFDIPQAQWPQLCARIDDILAGQAPLVADCPHAVEHEAQRIAGQLVVRGAQASGAAAGPTDVQPLDVDSLRLVRPRSVGVEQLGLWALEQLGLPALLAELGVNGALRAAAAGVIVGRLAHPASERATHRWLQERSGLGELLGVDFETVGAMQLYRASDALVKHREAIEAHLFDRAMGLFDLQPTVTLYDLTNTYFEGEASEQPQAQLEWAARSRLAPFVKLARTIRKHAAGILAYLDTKMTNGPVEGINNKLRVIARRAYGFHSPGALISMLFLCCGGIELAPPLPTRI